MFGKDHPVPPHPGRPGERRWLCRICGWILDEREGDPSRGIPPGTPLEALPPGWRCPGCGAGVSEFEPFADPIR